MLSITVGPLVVKKILTIFSTVVHICQGFSVNLNIKDFQFFSIIGFWKYTHQCLMMNHSFKRSFDSSVWPWGCQVRWQRAPCRLWERSYTSHRDLWLACLIGPQLGGKPGTSLKMSTSRGEILYWIEYFFRVCTLFYGWYVDAVSILKMFLIFMLTFCREILNIAVFWNW